MSSTIYKKVKAAETPPTKAGTHTRSPESSKGSEDSASTSAAISKNHLISNKSKKIRKEKKQIITSSKESRAEIKMQS